MGKKKPKKAETAGGSTPEIMVNVPGDAEDQDCRNGTKEVSCEIGMRILIIRKRKSEKRTDAKLARIDIANSGIVLKKQTAHRKIQPIVFLPRISFGVMVRFSQIYTSYERSMHTEIKYVDLRYL